MIRTIIWWALMIIIFAFIAQTRISLIPLKISFDNGWFALGVIFLFIGIVLIVYQSNNNAYLSGYSDGLKDYVKYLNEHYNIFKK